MKADVDYAEKAGRYIQILADLPRAVLFDPRFEQFDRMALSKALNDLISSRVNDIAGNKRN